MEKNVQVTKRSGCEEDGDLRRSPKSRVLALRRLIGVFGSDLRILLAEIDEKHHLPQRPKHSRPCRSIIAVDAALCGPLVYI